MVSLGKHSTFLFLLFLSGVVAVPVETDSLIFDIEDIYEEILDAFTTGQASDSVKELFLDLDLPSFFMGSRENWKELGLDNAPINTVFCATCTAGIDRVLHSLQNGTDPDAIIDMLINLCVDLELGNLNFCDHFLYLIEPELIFILETTPNLTGKDFCGTMFPGMGCKTDNPDRVWEVPLPAVPKPPITDPALPQPGAPTMKVVHLADTHYDPYYLPGSNAECGELYYCCREESGPVETPEAAAGEWGDYRNCDAPKWMLEHLYTDINTRHPDVDFIIWTGDLIPHNVWNTTREGNLQIIRDSVQLVRDYFPTTPVFPAIGNHEAHPVNSFPQPYIDNEFDISWLYDEIAALWQPWLPAEVASTITYAAYYSTLIKPGLRVLSTNTNYCYSLNWWLVYDDLDPGYELEWMAQELQKAEDTGEKVYIISHHPPGHWDCLPTWSHEYNKIVIRYEATVAGLFYGHTHKDEFTIFYDPDVPYRPVKVAQIAQSQTPYSNLNPGYKVYTVDGDYPGSSYQVLDHENYIMDLDEANFFNNTDFFLLYSAKEAYGMSDLLPTSYVDLVNQMNVPNSTVFDLFYKHFTKDGRPHREEGCSDTCKSNILCDLVTSDTSDSSYCDALLL